MIYYLFDKIKNAQVGSGSRDPKETLRIHKTGLARDFLLLIFFLPQNLPKLLFIEF
jgi:hypothetical protein